MEVVTTGDGGVEDEGGGVVGPTRRRENEESNMAGLVAVSQVPKTLGSIRHPVSRYTTWSAS